MDWSGHSVAGPPHLLYFLAFSRVTEWPYSTLTYTVQCCFIHAIQLSTSNKVLATCLSLSRSYQSVYVQVIQLGQSPSKFRSYCQVTVLFITQVILAMFSCPDLCDQKLILYPKSGLQQTMAVLQSIEVKRGSVSWEPLCNLRKGPDLDSGISGDILVGTARPRDESLDPVERANQVSLGIGIECIAPSRLTA